MCTLSKVLEVLSIKQGIKILFLTIKFHFATIACLTQLLLSLQGVDLRCPGSLRIFYTSRLMTEEQKISSTKVLQILNKSPISHRKHRNSTITKIPKGVNHSLLNCKKAIMKSFRKLEVLKPLEPIFKNKKDGPEQPKDYTIDQSDIIRLMAKQLKNRRLSRDHSKNYIRLNKSQNIDASRILEKSRNTEAENTLKKSFSKAKFKVRKVRRKTNIRSNNKSHNKQVLKMVKTMNKAISSSSEDSLDREESEEESKKLTKAPKLPLSNLHSSTMNYLTIPGLDNDFSSNQTNLVNSNSKDLKDRKLITKKSPIKSPSIKRRKMNNLSILVPQREGNLLNSKRKSPRTAEKCLHKFTYP